jgi:mannose-6-phosphate isomerase
LRFDSGRLSRQFIRLVKLAVGYIEKPWGRTELPPIFTAQPGTRIGEIWFASESTLPLLAKYLFTSEKLSVQVHPSDEQARARGLPRGKAECWYILDAEPGATIGLGLRNPLTREELRRAALNGSIIDAIDWRPIQAGDFFYVPPGTIHAIGKGISLLEIQQNSDVTYRLYDYGRPRELHLDEGIAVSTLEPYAKELFQHLIEGEETVLVDGPKFTLIQSSSDQLEDRTRWLLPLEGIVRCDGATASAGECLLVNSGERAETDAARLLIAAGC